MCYKSLPNIFIHSRICLYMSQLIPDIMAHRDVVDHDDRSKPYQNADEREQTFAKKEKTTVYISHPTYPLTKSLSNIWKNKNFYQRLFRICLWIHLIMR